MVLILKNNSWGIRKFGVVRVKSSHLTLVRCMGTLGFGFIKPLFFGESPHLFRRGTVQ